GGGFYSDLKARGVVGSIGIAAVFFVAATAVVILRDDAVPYKPGQFVPQDVLSRVDFSHPDPERLANARRERRESWPHVYRADGDAWNQLQASLSELPERVGERNSSELPGNLATALQIGPGGDGVLNILRDYRSASEKPKYQKAVEDFIKDLRPLVLLPKDQRDQELAKATQRFVSISIPDHGDVRVEDTLPAGANKELAD